MHTAVPPSIVPLLTSPSPQAGVYFSEIDASSSGVLKYVPRSVQVDLEAGVCDKVRVDPLRICVVQLKQRARR